VLAVTGALVVPVLAAGPAWAAPAVQVQSAVGTATASATEPTAVTVSGTGFQSVQGGFGGIYVMFGWVDPTSGAWAPSQGGVSGVDYRYAADTASVDNEGFQRFVAFPGSDTASAANGGEIAADGTWSVTLTIPTPQLDLIGLDGATTPVDCTVETCGILTIGAHGVANAANETFTPITFADDLAAPAGAATTAGPGEPAASAAGEADRTAAAVADDHADPADGSATAEGVQDDGLPVGALVAGGVALLVLAVGALAVIRHRVATARASAADVAGTADPQDPPDPGPRTR
jgi:hypothetical protein